VDNNFWCRFLIGTKNLLIVSGVIVPFMLGMRLRIHVLPDLLSIGSLSLSQAYLVGLSALIPIGLTLFLAFRRKDPHIYHFFILIIIGLTLRFIFVFAINNQLLSDYLTMWNYAQSVILGEAALPAKTFQEVRTLTYLLPVTFIFNGERIGYEVVNVIFSLGSSLLAYLFAKNIAGQRVGLIALGLSIFAPEPIFACEVPTHDIPGTFYFLCAMNTLVIGFRRWDEGRYSFFKTAILAIVGGLFIGLTDIQRGIGVFVCLGLFIVFILWAIAVMNKQQDGPFKLIQASTILLLIPIIISISFRSVLFSKYVDNSVYAESGKFATWGWIASYSGPDSTGDYGEYRALQPVLKGIEIEKLPEFAMNKVLMEYHEKPFGIIRHYIEKSSRLYNLGRQGGEYYGSLEKNTFATRYVSGKTIRQVLDAYSSFYALILSILSISALIVHVLAGEKYKIELLPIIFLSVISLALIGVGEIQSRYVFPAWFVLPVYIGLIKDGDLMSRLRDEKKYEGIHAMFAPAFLCLFSVSLFVIWVKFWY
jgi:hypothetical protein